MCMGEHNSQVRSLHTGYKKRGAYDTGFFHYGTVHFEYTDIEILTVINRRKTCVMAVVSVKKQYNRHKRWRRSWGRTDVRKWHCGNRKRTRWKRKCVSLSSVETVTEVILWPRSFKNCTADSLFGPKVSKAIGWNTYDPDNAAYLACFLDAAISAAAPAEDAEAKM